MLLVNIGDRGTTFLGGGDAAAMNHAAGAGLSRLTFSLRGQKGRRRRLSLAASSFGTDNSQQRKREAKATEGGEG